MSKVESIRRDIAWCIHVCAQEGHRVLGLIFRLPGKLIITIQVIGINCLALDVVYLSWLDQILAALISFWT